MPRARARPVRLPRRGEDHLLNHVPANRDGCRVAVVVNDMSEVNIDAVLLAGRGTLDPTTERLVELTDTIGGGVTAEDVYRRLDPALLTDAELAAGPDNWRALPDPLPAWDTEPAHIHS